MRKPDAQKRELKKREILKAASRCFAREGFQRTTIADICAEADIGAGHLYHYFRDKEAIVVAMAEATLAVAARDIGRLARQPRPLSALIAEVEAASKSSRRRRRMFIEVLAEAFNSDAIAAALRAHSAELCRLLAGLLAEGQAAGEVDPTLAPELGAALILCVHDGAKILSIRHPPSDPERMAALLGELLRRFLAAPAV